MPPGEVNPLPQPRPELGVEDAVSEDELVGRVLALIPTAFATLQEAENTVARLRKQIEQKGAE